jgi:hypothetical protein
VIVEAAPAGGEAIVKIEPANPQVIYVPAYNPTAVYGSWSYPAYPPTYWPPYPAYYPGAALATGFAWGVGLAAAGAIFGNANWGGGDVNINVNKAANIDRNFDRTKVEGGRWQHDGSHRQGVAYRDNAIRRAAGAPTRRTEASAPTVRAQAIALERRIGRMRIIEGQSRTDRPQTREIAREARIGRQPASAAAPRTAQARATCHAPATVRAAPAAASAGGATTPFRASAQAARRNAAPTVDAPACKARASADLPAAAACGPAEAAAHAVADARGRRSMTSLRRFCLQAITGALPTVALACALCA